MRAVQQERADHSQRWTVVIVLLVAQVACVVLISNRLHPVRPVLAVQLPAFVLSVVVLLLLRHFSGSGSLNLGSSRYLLLGGCAAMQVAALLGPPATSDDDNRYVWDGKVQLAGIDPYRYSPADPALTRLRDGFTFPHQQPCLHNLVEQACTTINRPTAHTIYPPVAQLAFDVERIASLGGHFGHLPLQILAALGVFATTWLLIVLAGRRRAPLWPVAVWALSPITALEATNNAHIDWLACLFVVLGLLALRAGRPRPAGLAIGAAIATKLYPVVFFVTAGRRPLRLIGAAIALVGFSYLPHIAAVGPEVLGYLPQYLKEESYSNGGRYIVVGWLVGQQWAAVAAPLALGVGLLAIWWRADEGRPEQAAVSGIGLYLLVTTPNYAWYALILIAMIAASGQLRWLWLAFAPSLQYMSSEIYGAHRILDPHIAAMSGYGVAAVVLAAASLSNNDAVRHLIRPAFRLH